MMNNFHDKVSTENLDKISTKIRLKCIEMANKTRTGHIGSAFSMVDILTALFFSVMNNDFNNKNPDKFILSKGHGALAYYATLYMRGLISEESILQYLDDGSKMMAFPSQDFHPGLEFSSGSLGHGLSVAAGLAYGQKIMKNNSKVFVICSDGECQEGSTWEAIQFAGQHKLSNLVVIVDGNKVQAIDYIENVLSQSGLSDCWGSLGFDVVHVDGHDPVALVGALNNRDQKDKPTLVWANTIKGKGVSFMENSIEWHYLGLNDEQVYLATNELMALL